jgi:hypothetical protein
VRMTQSQSGSETSQATSITGRLPGWDGLAVVLLGAGAGLLWGLVSLIFGMFLHLAPISAPLRVAAALFTLPLSLAWWLGSTLQLPLVDPTGLVLATGTTLGVLPVVAWLGVERWRA